MQQASALVQFLSSLFPSWDSPPTISQFTSGQSNPTFLLSATSPLASPTQLVLRTKPAGRTLDRTAHRVDKEYALLRALGEWTELRGGVRTPRVHGFCPQGSCDGWGDFYLMQYIKGGSSDVLWFVCRHADRWLVHACIREDLSVCADARGST